MGYTAWNIAIPLDIKKKVQEIRGNRTMERWVNGNLVLYIVYDEEIHQYTYTIFDQVKGTVQTFLNKQTAKEVYYA